MATEIITSERNIPSSPEAIFEVLADPGRHPEIDGSGTVKASNGDGDRLAIGSVFGMNMRRGAKYVTRNVVVEFQEGRRIAWQTVPVSRFLAAFAGGRIWRYELEPTPDGVLVRETWDIGQEKIKALVRPMAKKVRSDMNATLQRLEAVVST